MKLIRGWGNGPPVQLIGSGAQIDAAERWQRSIRRAAGVAPGGPAIDAQLRALVMRFGHFRRDMQSQVVPGGGLRVAP